MAQTDDDDDDDDSASIEAPHRGKMDMMMKSNPRPTPTGHWYTSQGIDGAIFSTAVMEKPGMRRDLTTIRFSGLNFGFHINYDFDEHFGIYSGLGIKNIGFIEKDGDSTTKRRLYTLGAPLGFKLGNLQKRNFGFIGGGVDFPINYREKRFVKRNDKYKFNEFFSDRTDDFMPYLFAGIARGGSTIKVQYYPGNFFNTGFEEDNNGRRVQPYRGYRVNLLYVTLGLDIHHKGHKPHKKADEEAAAPAEM